MSKNEEHNAYMREKIKCEGCGRMVPRCHKTAHLRSSLHKKNTNDTDELKKYRKIMEEKYDQKIQSLERSKKKLMDAINEQICEED